MVGLATVLILFALKAEAKIFSFITDKVPFVDKFNIEVPGNSQRMLVLESNYNPDPRSGATSSDITIVDDSTLAADVGPLGTMADVLLLPANDQITTYVVKPGDTLSDVAEMHQVSINTILWANNLTSKGAIHPGQELVILPITGIRHTVKKGDTLAKIAKQYGADSSDIASYNGLAGDKGLVVGEQVIVPEGQAGAQAVAKRYASSGAQISSGYFVRPTKGVRSQGIHGYNGIDIAAPIGTDVWAAASGRVVVARGGGGWNGGYGNYVVIAHSNGTQTLYGHLSQVFVSTGQSVGQGEAIGAVGNTGRSTGSHLHFEVRGAKNPF